jgi:twinkle protein
MQVNNTEINGFLIDQFNQHNLDVGKTQGICPLCSSNRQPKHQKLKCASYDWERGLGTCHHCDSSFQLHTYQRKGSSQKTYIRPDALNVVEPKDITSKVFKWFESRGISQKTLDDLMVTEGPEFMPQTGKSENTIQFNYIIGDELINVKYRDGRKNFKLYKGAEKVFYNINSIVGFDTCVITEGEMDVLALHEAGITNAISVPNGATLNSNNLDYLDNCIDYFEDKEKVILAVDNDEPGQALQQELIRRLGAEVCFIASFEDCKDANEYLIKYGKEQLRNKINDARPVPLENVKTFKDIEDEITDFVKNGFKPGYQIGLPNFDDSLSLLLGYLVAESQISLIRW